MSLLFNEAALVNLLESPHGPLGTRLRFVSETVAANYEAVVAKIWENQSALARPNVDFQLSFGDFGLQSEIGLVDNGRVADYMSAKFHREDWVVPAMMAGWDDEPQMAGAGPADLFDTCLQVLDASIDALDTIPSLAPGLLGAPERAFVSAGTPALDCCNQLTVNAAPIGEAPTRPLEMGAGTRHQQQFRKNYVGFAITITRCGDWTDMPPPAAQLQAIAEQTNADAWALWNYLWNSERSGRLFSICGGVFNDRLVPLTPSGGCSGWVFSFRAEVEGYETEF